MVFHYLDDLDSKLAAVRVALATPSGDEEWSAYSAALGRKFLKLDEFLKGGTPEPSPESANAAAAATNATGPAPKPKPEAPSLLRKLFS